VASTLRLAPRGDSPTDAARSRRGSDEGRLRFPSPVSSRLESTLQRTRTVPSIASSQGSLWADVIGWYFVFRRCESSTSLNSTLDIRENFDTC